MLIGTAVTADGKNHKVFATDKAYFVPDMVTKKDPHGVRIGRTILQCEIPQDQALKLISEGKTDLLKGFVSNKTKRKFDAFLTFDPVSTKIGFDFPPRPAKKAAKAKE
jgi:DNA topoisomerase-3